MKPILDACCGGRAFWFDKNNPQVLFCDNRVLNERLCDGRMIEVNPEVICDFTALPFPDKTFWHVVFDPPHLIDAGENSWLVKRYGKLPKEWHSLIRGGSTSVGECLKQTARSFLSGVRTVYRLERS